MIFTLWNMLRFVFVNGGTLLSHMINYTQCVNPNKVEGRLSLVLKKEVEKLSKFVNRGICRDMPCFQVTSTTIFITKKRDFVCYLLVRQNFDVRKELKCKKSYCKYKSIPRYQDFPVRCLIA